jgi:hypothetical protein
MERKHIKIKQINKLNKREYRVINIDKDSYKIIKDYCDNNSLKVSKWITHQILTIIKNNKVHE